MKKALRTSIRLVILLIVAIVIMISGWIAYQYIRNPIQALGKGIPDVQVGRVRSYPVQLPGEVREYRDISLIVAEGDSIQITVSLPGNIPAGGLPVLIILGGLEIGRESLKYIPRQGQNVLIAYQYPYSPHYWYEDASIRQIPLIRRAVLRVPRQVLAVIRWAKQQPWFEGRRVSVLGYSFGAMFVPAIYHLAAARQMTIGPGILAYGGADIAEMLRANLRFLPSVSRRLVATFAAAAIRPIEPALHLPRMQGEFLVINGRRDHQIPRKCWQKFQQLIPEPKTVIILDEGHLHPNKPELTRRLVEISREWLLERGAINP